jgi:hypothetical protein
MYIYIYIYIFPLTPTGTDICNQTLLDPFLWSAEVLIIISFELENKWQIKFVYVPEMS